MSMKPIILVLAFTAASGVALAQTQTPTAPPGPGAGNPPSGWSGGATPPQSDTGKMHPDGKGPPGTPPTVTAPPHAGDVRIASETDARKAIESEGFTRVSGLKKDPDGAWSGRAMRGTSNVAVRVDARGNVSAE
jgi:hypothetical protein